MLTRHSDALTMAQPSNSLVAALTATAGIPTNMGETPTMKGLRD